MSDIAPECCVEGLQEGQEAFARDGRAHDGKLLVRRHRVNLNTVLLLLERHNTT
jgi:hypothetical protein